MSNQNNVTNSLAHTKWNCKYHIVFAKVQKKSILWRKKTGDKRNS